LHPPEFITLTELLLDVDRDNDFYCGLEAGNERRKRHAQRLVEKDPLIPKVLHDKNALESVSAICNVYSSDKKGNMFAGVHGRNVASEQNAKKKHEKMRDKFAQWKIDMKWVILFPHVNDFNA
jgi:hypothetical protein